jgi:hypothetical protein
MIFLDEGGQPGAIKCLGQFHHQVPIDKASVSSFSLSHPDFSSQTAIFDLSPFSLMRSRVPTAICRGVNEASFSRV